ncbi:MAG: hypothetical protein JXA01_04700 [Dehalococcoidia bacterium]|nr:hypothetical protein [Dehalococcoidia bacterium]
MRILKGFLMFMGVLAVLAIIILIIGYVLALLTPDMRSNMRPVVLSSEAVDSLNSKLDTMKKDAAEANANDTKKNIELLVTEEEINSIIVMTLAEGNLPAKEMLVNFNDGYLLAYNAWNFPALPAKTCIMGSIAVENAKPNFMVRSFYLGKLPLSSAINKNVQDIINIGLQLNAPLDELKLDLQEITISEGQMRLMMVTRSGK